MARQQKPTRCLYEILNLPTTCDASEIRTYYKRLALQRHPDKLVQSGVPESEATSSFQELVNAYEVLSDPKERAWYDSHRNQILYAEAAANRRGSGSVDFGVELFSFFSRSVYSGYGDTGRGFYKVYGDLFGKVYENEVGFARKFEVGVPKEAPVMGNAESPYTQVTAFYNYWSGFVTVLDFFWVDKHETMPGLQRKTRRLMEEENKKLRKAARREYNETVRGLAAFVKKRDKRVIDMQIKRNAEMEKKREEEKQRKKELERQKAENARNYVEPEWAKVEEEEEQDDEAENEEGEKKNELYCVVCKKKFKSDKQWKNHEQSKKHKEKVAELREAFSEEDKEYEAEEKSIDGNDAGYLSADDGLNELQQQFEDSVGIQGDENADGTTESSDAEEFADVNNHSETNGVGAEPQSDNDEASVLEAMLLGHKNKKKVGNNKAKAPAEKIEVENDSDELEFMEYNNTKGSRRNRRGRKGRKGESQEKEEAEETRADVTERNDEGEEHDGHDNDSGESSSNPIPEPATKVSHRGRRRRKGGKQEKEEEAPRADVAEKNDDGEEHDRHDTKVGESSFNPLPKSESKGSIGDATDRIDENSEQDVRKKNTKKKENASKSRGRKQKVSAADGSDNVCEKCGAEFDSRNRLHKHLGETGHALIKSR